MTPYSNVNRAMNVSENCEQQSAAPDPFANLESLRLDQSYLETVGVRNGHIWLSSA